MIKHYLTEHYKTKTATIFALQQSAMKLKKVILSPIIATTIFSCTDSPISPQHQISFTAEYAHETRSNSTIPAGTIAILHISHTSDTTQNNLFPSTILRSDGKGKMNSPNPLFIKQGYYNIYALSSGNQLATPFEKITHNVFTPSNYKDYVWACKKNVIVNSSTPVNLNFRHIASKITFKTIKPEYCDNITVNTMSYTPPDTSTSNLCITKGTITPATLLLPPVILSGSGNDREIITIPCANISSTVTASITTTFNGTTSQETIYTATLGFPIEQGTHYIVELIPQKETDMTVRIFKTKWFVKEDIIPYTAH